MRKQIALLVAVAGFATISAQAQDYCSGYTLVENFGPNTWEPTAFPPFLPPSADLSVTTVPEPSTLALCAIGLASVTIARRSFRQRRS